ncbi:DUF1428 domain-containing protein [Roseomonas terrae]|uniref:DUF1428 domain-containing protein n=1 Tax=Neoroseomonas terrae TaxID=424799 RepID=A0ABS5EJJ3_9PROT|nr:DUF1428 domain-containing protein [Neoroseomonas terrae]MBR0651199.1 DUF1428 domain-containing protein [Neoroseomonas terrae]
MTYVDGYLAPVPANKREQYVALSKRTGAVLKEYGALRIVECWIDDQSGDDAQFHADDARDGLGARTPAMVTSFAQAMRLQPGEAIVFAWTEWPDKETRDRGLAAAMADPRMHVADTEEAIFDGKRLIASGFIPIVEL